MAVSPFVRFRGVWNNTFETRRGGIATTYYAPNQLRSGRRSVPWGHAKRPPRQRVRSSRLTGNVTFTIPSAVRGNRSCLVACLPEIRYGPIRDYGRITGHSEVTTQCPVSGLPTNGTSTTM